MQYIQTGNGLSARDHLGERFCQRRKQFVIQRFFPGQRFAVGAEDLVFKFFQFRCNKPFGIFQSLSSDVLRRKFDRGLPFADFDVIPVNAVKTNFKRAYSRALFFSQFQIDQVLSGVAAEIS